MNNEAELRMTKARVSMIQPYPFLGTLAVNLTLHEDNSQPKLYTNGIVLGYNSEYVKSLTHEVLMEEILTELRKCGELGQ